jgi:hypothetical protein
MDYLARDCPSWNDQVRLIDATPLPCGNSRDSGRRSELAADLPENLAASQQYLRDFTTVANWGGSVGELVHGMLDLHGQRDQPHTLWISARA